MSKRMTMDEKRDLMWKSLAELNGETVARLFTDYHGLQLMNEGFWEFLQDEGYIYSEECEDDEED